MNVARLVRTLDQELVALARGASLECPVCGEFVLRLPVAGGRRVEGPRSERRVAVRLIACPECRSILADGVEIPEIEVPSVVQAG